MNGYIEDNTGSKYIILIFVDENKNILRKYEEI